MADSLTIGQLARTTGVPPKTIRYYEHVGVLPAAERTRAGYRTYGRRGVDRLRFVRRARALGVPLAQIKTLVAALDGDAAMRPRLRELVRAQLATVEHRLTALRALQRELEDVRRRLDTRSRSRRRGPCRCLETDGASR
ncbi:MAG: MerR family transcriptional regulator [Candidatus Rokubacteria bacterium]|nr:MerR family transcriptional regulator [Candidatus Rokubacteria bacterium]